MKRRGSFSDKKRPVITLNKVVTPTEAGIINVSHSIYKPADPNPSSWLMLKPGDLLVSQSGTSRLLLKKDWQAGKAESLRLTWQHEGERLGASLDIEKMEINSSNFEHLTMVLRPYAKAKVNPATYRPDHFTKTVRFNVLTLLGFGNIGSVLHQLFTNARSRELPQQIYLDFGVDSISGQFQTVQPIDVKQRAKKLPSGLLLTKVTWTKDPERDLYVVTEFSYPASTSAIAIETITLASEIANAFSLASVLFGAKGP